MFAVLGDIVFELLNSPDGFESSRSWDYAEHRVVQDRPKLQWIANNLEIIELDFQFHSSFTDPSTQLAALLAAGDDHYARPLVFGNGVHRGYFIVTSIRTSARQMSADGRLIAITVKAVLREWALESELDANSSPLAVFPLIGIVAAPPGTDTSSIAFIPGTGVSSEIGAPSAGYVAPAIASPGVSPLLSIPEVAGLPTPYLTVSDVAPSAIVRASH